MNPPNKTTKELNALLKGKRVCGFTNAGDGSVFVHFVDGVLQVNILHFSPILGYVEATSEQVEVMKKRFREAGLVDEE